MHTAWSVVEGERLVKVISVSETAETVARSLIGRRTYAGSENSKSNSRRLRLKPSLAARGYAVQYAEKQIPVLFHLSALAQEST